MGFLLVTGPGFVFHSQTHRSARPNRVYVRYGRLFHFLLLSTSSRDDAVTFSYRPEWAYLKRTYTSLAKHAYRRTSAGALLPLWERRLAAALLRRATPREGRGLPALYNSSVAELLKIRRVLLIVVVCVDASNEALDAASKRRINDRLGSD